MKKEDLFKSIGTIEDNLIEKSEEINKEKTSRKNWSNRTMYRFTKGVAVAACLCLCVLGAIFIYPVISNPSKPSDRSEAPSSLDHNEEPINQEEPGSFVAEHRDETKVDQQLQERIQELQSGDSLGWLVMDQKIYIQTAAPSKGDGHGSEDEDKYLGKASDFIGYYQNPESCDGEVYLFDEDAGILRIKLDNGGEVFLATEDTNITSEPTISLPQEEPSAALTQ